MDNNWEKSVIEKVLLETVKEQRRARRWKIFFRFFWLIIIGFILFYAFSRKDNTVIEGKHVAVVNLKGMIGFDTNAYQNVTDGLRDALEDKDTVAVIIRANSPGGSPVYSDMIYNEIMRLRKKYPSKPIYVAIEEMCASGCYYIASAANKIYAVPSSILGSIGVIYTGFGLTGLMQKLGIDNRLLISGRNKAMGYPFIPENKEQREMQQKMLDEIHQQFITAVKNGRGKRLKSDPDMFSGRYWIGEDALKLGLIDGYGTVDSIALEQYKTDNIVNYTPEPDPFERVAKKFGVSIVSYIKQSISDSELGQYK